MRVLSRMVFREVAASAFLGTVLFTFVLFLQKAGSLFSILVHNSAPPRTVCYLFALVLPQTLPFTVPLGVLVGVLIGLSRMSTDGEITALRASGVPGRRVLPPILAFAVFGLVLTACASLWLTPWATRETYRVLNHILAEQVTAEIEPRIFEEQFNNKILYVGDFIPGPVVRWRDIFIADVTPPDQRPKAADELADEPSVTVASEAIATPDVAHNRIQLSLTNPYKYEVHKDLQYTASNSLKGEQVLDAQKQGEVHTRASRELDTGPLYRQAYRDPKQEHATVIEDRIELNQRVALPPACILFALVGIPLGISSRKGGKSTAFVMTAALAFLYWMGLIAFIGLARQGTLPVAPAVWMPDAVFAVFGLLMILRLEEPGDRDWIGRARLALTGGFQRLRGTLAKPVAVGGASLLHFRVFPQLIDTYVLSSFIFYFVLLLCSLVLTVHVFTFFDLLSDIIKNKIAMSRVLAYLFFLTPELIYETTPISVLVAVLITFGILTKHNESTAFKASGISLYRLSAPILVVSGFLSVGLFAFDQTYLPDANRKQDALRNEIKGRPVQTYLRPDRKWIFGGKSRIYYYKYFDPHENVMGGVSVYEIDPKSFSLTRHISAEKARWEPSLHTWVFYNGWSRNLKGIRQDFHPFQGQTMTFSELNEPPANFLREEKQGKQMNFEELSGYIRGLQQSGFDTVPLQVVFHRKFSVPLFALIMAILSFPLSFVAGNRGAMTGVGLSLGFWILYSATNSLFEQIGNVNQLPPPIAAWSPDALFFLAGLYFMMRLRT